MRASVVVPTRDRPEYLSRCLAALTDQTLPASDYEIIVVDDGSTPPVADGLDAAVAPRVKVVRRSAAGGPAAARNDGVRVASGTIVAFTDDDCRPDRSWLEAGCRAIEQDLDVATGRTIPEPDERAGAGPFSYSMDVPGPDPRYSTCNCFYRAGVLRSAGGFRDLFYSSAGYHLGEDTDLAWRAIEAGARAGFVPEAVVYHAIRPRGFWEHLRSRRRLENMVPLVKRYPGVKRAHLSRHFYSLTHLLVYVAVVGLVASVRSPWALLLLVPYVVWRSREKRRLLTAPWVFFWRNRALPQRLVADVYECFVLARASVRHRHVVL